MVVLRPFTGRLFDRKGVYMLVIPALAFAAVGMWLIGIGMTLAMILIASFFMAVGQGCGVPSIQAHALNRLGRERAGVAVSTIQIGQNLGNAFGPMVGGMLVVPLGYKTMFAGFGLVLFVLGLLLTGVQFVSEKRKKSA